MDIDQVEVKKENKGGRKFSANPKVVRITLLVTPAERQAWQAAADAATDGNISILIRQAVARLITPRPANS